MTLNPSPSGVERVIGLDSHPDTFTAATIVGQTPAQAIVQTTYNRIPMARLQTWATKNTTPKDLIVLEASGNSFQVVRSLAQVQRQALVLESCHLGKLKEAHANNDKISAVRIAKAYLAGTAKTVWVPDALSQERRDWLHAHRKCVKRTTQTQNRLLSYLSDNGVRLAKGQALEESLVLDGPVGQTRKWSPRQRQVLSGYFMELTHAQRQREHWQSLIAQEVLADPLLLSMVRLCGVREIVAFSLGAIIGDIKRFANSAKLVKYIGLNPAFDHSGEGQWKGGIGGHGRKDLRALLIESAQSIMRSPDHPQAKWGRHLMASKGSANLAVAAVARKLTVAIWYLMMGKWSALEEVDSRLDAKLGKIIANVGPPGLKALDKTRKQLKEESRQTIRTGRIYILHPLKKPAPRPEPDPLPHQKPDRCQHCGAPKALLTKKTNKTAGAQTSNQPQPSNQPLRPKTSAPQGHNP